MASQANETLKGFLRLVKGIFTVKVEEGIGCDECFSSLDLYTDMIAQGKDPSIVMKDVKDHLAQCPCCEEEFQALLSMIKSIE